MPRYHYKQIPVYYRTVLYRKTMRVNGLGKGVAYLSPTRISGAIHSTEPQPVIMAVCITSFSICLSRVNPAISKQLVHTELEQTSINTLGKDRQRTEVRNFERHIRVHRRAWRRSRQQQVRAFEVTMNDGVPSPLLRVFKCRVQVPTNAKPTAHQAAPVIDSAGAHARFT